MFFFAVPLYYMARTSLEDGTIFTGYQFAWNFETYTDAISNYDEQLDPVVRVRRRRHR